MARKWWEYLADLLLSRQTRQTLSGRGAKPIANINIPLTRTGYRVKTVRLIRDKKTDTETLGTIDFEGQHYETIERPDKNNEPMVSCIPAGTYHVTYEMSPSRGEKTFRLVNVPGRSGILIHPANWAYQLMGCIALGLTREMLADKMAVTASRAAVAKFEEQLKREPFDLEIVDC